MKFRTGTQMLYQFMRKESRTYGAGKEKHRRPAVLLLCSSMAAAGVVLFSAAVITAGMACVMVMVAGGSLGVGQRAVQQLGHPLVRFAGTA